MQHWPIIVLSLPGEEARRAPLLQALTEMNLHHEVFLGVDGRDGLSDRWLTDIDRCWAYRNHERDLTDGEFACALSHREIYRLIGTRCLSGAIVLEDDAIVGRKFLTFVQQKHFLEAPLMMLDHSHARVIGPEKNLLHGLAYRKLSLPSCLTTAYSISANAACALLKHSAPIRNQADWPGDIVALGAVALNPRIVDHPDPVTGTSHLRAGREQMARRGGNIERTLRRFTSTAHWKRWLIKRRSTRIS